MLQWHKLSSGLLAWRSFEHLCYQLAVTEYQGLGRFTPVDDRGGGDGAEFYLELPGKKEWAWEAKFYFPELRLNSSRERAISQSLTRVTSRRPRVEKWFLCTPTDFTPGEVEWWRDELALLAPGVELIHWGDRDLEELLARPQNRGRLSFFFGELELSPTWFDRHTAKQLANAREVAHPSLHVQTDLEREIDNLLGAPAAQEVVTHALSQFTSLVEKAHKLLVTVERSTDEPLPVPIRTTAAEIRSLLERLLGAWNQLTAFSSSLDNQQFADAARCELPKSTPTEWRRDLDLIRSQLVDDDEFGFDSLVTRATRDEELRDVEQAGRVHGLAIDLRTILDRVGTAISRLSYAQKAAETFQAGELQVLGDAGIGKTHLLAAVVRKRQAGSLPTVFLLGSQFMAVTTVQDQCRRILDVPDSYSWVDLLDSLEASAIARGARALIALDGLNEAFDPRLWQSQLGGFVEEIRRRPSICLVTSCRTSYSELVWGTREPPHMRHIEGFAGSLVEDAIEKYFSHFRIHADLTVAPLEQFEHPLYLRIFCEGANPRRDEDIEVFIGERTLFKVFEDYLEKVDRRICERLDKPPSRQLVSTGLGRFASRLWEESDRYLAFNEALDSLDGRTIQQVEWNTSLTKAMLDENVLLSRDWIQAEDRLAFTYDLFGAYLIARELMPAAVDHSSWWVPELHERLVEGPHRHPLAEDVMRCLAALAPERLGCHLHEVSDDAQVVDHSFRALFEIDPQFIDQPQSSLVHEQFMSQADRRDWWFQRATTTMFTTKHPLNAQFWMALLFELKPDLRDEVLRDHETRSLGRLLARFASLGRKVSRTSDTTQVGKGRLRLELVHAAIFAGSSTESVRRAACDAINQYAVVDPTTVWEIGERVIEGGDWLGTETILGSLCIAARASHTRQSSLLVEDWAAIEKRVREFVPSSACGSNFAARSLLMLLLRLLRDDPSSADFLRELPTNGPLAMIRPAGNSPFEEFSVSQLVSLPAGATHIMQTVAGENRLDPEYLARRMCSWMVEEGYSLRDSSDEDQRPSSLPMTPKINKRLSDGVQKIEVWRPSINSRFAKGWWIALCHVLATDELINKCFFRPDIART